MFMAQLLECTMPVDPDARWALRGEIKFEPVMPAVVNKFRMSHLSVK